jgi:hypothetical protein
MKKFNQLTAAFAFLTIGLVNTIPQRAIAIPSITQNFTVVVTTAPLNGDQSLTGNTYSGSFTYSPFTGSGTESATAFNFTFFQPYSLTLGNVTAEPLTFVNGVLTSWEFGDTTGTNTLASGTPSFAVSSGYSPTPNFVYGFNNSSGYSYTNSNGACQDPLNACQSVQGSGTFVPFEVPGGTAIPVLGSVLALGVMGSLKKRIVSK